MYSAIMVGLVMMTYNVMYVCVCVRFLNASFDENHYKKIENINLLLCFFLSRKRSEVHLYFGSHSHIYITLVELLFLFFIIPNT